MRQPICVRITALWHAAISRWPLVWRRTLNHEVGKFQRHQRGTRKFYEEELASTRVKSQKLVDILVNVTPERREWHYRLVIELDRAMIEQASINGDRGLWEYLAADVAHKVETELRTMDFAGLNERALQAERASYTHRIY